MKIVSLVLLFFLLFNNVSLATSLKTIQVGFEREYGSKDTKEVTKGTIYYKAPDKLKLAVAYPVKQWIIIEGENVVIYYPEEKRAFRITAKNPVSLPFFQAFVGVVKEDYGLTDLGYSLSNHEKKEDTLVTYWTPAKRLSGILGRFKLVYVSNKIVYAELTNPDGMIISKSRYSNHIYYGSSYFPLEISTTRYVGENSTFEKIIYHNPRFNEKLPQKVMDFMIPLDVEIEEIKW